MMKHTLLIILLLGLSVCAHGQTPTRTIVVTIDDLPYVQIADGPYLTQARAATAKILSTLKKHKVSAVAFVVEGHLGDSDERDARIALLRQWVDAGMTLGNHTYSHRNPNRLSVEKFEERRVGGDSVSGRLMGSGEPYQL